MTVAVIKRWKDLVYVRGRRHDRRGVAKRQRANNIADHLVSHDAWMQRLYVGGGKKWTDHLVSHDAWMQRLDMGGGKKMNIAAVSRIMEKAVNFNNEVIAIRLANTGAAAGVSKTP